jgi:glutathione S-transferase
MLPCPEHDKRQAAWHHSKDPKERNRAMMKLRYAAASPFVRKVLVVVHEHDLASRIELVPTTLSPVQANAALAAENPLMKVPSLLTDDGDVLFDSPVICEYLDALAHTRKLIPPAGPTRWAALRQQALADGILEAVILCRYEMLRPVERRWTGWTDGQMQKAHQGLAAADREDLDGPRTIGHIALGCMIGYLDLRFPEDGWRRRHPRLAAWYGREEQLPSMQATKPPAG